MIALDPVSAKATQWGCRMVKTIPNVHRKSIYFFRWPAMDSRQQQPSYYRLHLFVKVGCLGA